MATHALPAAAPTQHVRIVSRFRNARGNVCNVIKQSVLIDGARVLATGTVCRQPDGRWTLVP
ncbi:MAG: hypothetical protein ACLQJR_28410 [Stellaceae bacterium]